MGKYFFIAYLIMAVITGGLILNDYSACYRWSFGEPSAMGGSGLMLIGGMLWPLTMTSMLVLYEEKDGRFCLG